MTEPAEIEALKEEVRDRFGVVPEPARTFFATALLRLLGGASDIESVLVRGNEARITFASTRCPV
jgi:transcription-repair coupling factor (superfamily II helicase)